MNPLTQAISGREIPRRGALRGTTCAIKENIDVAGTATTAGSAALMDFSPISDAPIVTLLTAAGVVLTAKSAMSELAISFGRLGYGSQAGAIINPCHPLRDASGSSSGSAAAVAAGLVDVAVGTDTSGSVRAPAAVTGTFGLRPTVGAMSTEGVFPSIPSLDTVGFIAPTLQRLRGLAQACGLAQTGSVRGVGTGTVGVVDNWEGIYPAGDQALHAAEHALTSAGHATTRIQLPAWASTLYTDIIEPLWEAEFPDAIDNHPTLGLTFAQLTECIGQITAPHLPNPELVRALRQLARRSDRERHLARQRAHRITSRDMPGLREALHNLMDGLRLDALLMPTLLDSTGPAYGFSDPRFVPTGADPYAPCYLASVTGTPALTVPAGTDPHGLPVGVMLHGRRGDEAILLDLAQALD